MDKAWITNYYPIFSYTQISYCICRDQLSAR